MSETTVYLIRHSEQLRMEKVIRNEEIPLSTNGERLAERLSETRELQGIDKLFSSNYLRAYLTAKYIAEKNQLEIIVDERLRGTQVAEI